MSEITAEQIRKATSFVLSDNRHFDEDTRIGKPYTLHVDKDGTVYHIDDDGYKWIHVFGNGEIGYNAELALKDRHITYHLPNKTPKYFSVEAIHVLDEGDHFVSIRTDSTGFSRLRELEREVNIKSELEVLKRQLDEIQRKIDELEQAK